MKELIHNEIIARLNNLVQDIRFQKEQQWKTAYYNILIYGSIIAIFQINVEIIPSLFEVFRYLACLVIIGVAILLWIFQNRHFKTYQEYVQRESIIRDILVNFVEDLEMIKPIGVARLIDKRYDEQNKKTENLARRERKTLQKKINEKRNRKPELFYKPFLVVNVFGAVAALIIVLFDK